MGQSGQNSRTVAVIVADDLTGAADACATFVTYGLTGTVAFGADAGAAADVIAVSTDSRARSSALAAERVREAVRLAAASHHPALLFKKIDSTLRGHVGEEVNAAMEASRARVAIVAPAFPAMGRTVEHGLLRVTGTGAITPRHVAGRLESHGVRSCRRIPRPASAIHAGVDWRDRMSDAIKSGARALVCDSVDDADLDGIVEAAWTLEGPVLWVGSAGLADALARRLGAAAAPAERLAIGSGPRGSVIMWIGSHHPATNAQQHYLAEGLGHDGQTVAVVSESEIEAAAECLDRGRHVLVDISRHSANEVVARMVASVVDRPLAGFVMSGGDTAARVCRMLDATCIELGGEVRRGIPWGWLRTRTGRRWPVVLKSGGFGGEDALHHALACLSGEGPGRGFERAEAQGASGPTDG
jgi:uncharacterized protein YgbK (DUF1537 family)